MAEHARFSRMVTIRLVPTISKMGSVLGAPGRIRTRVHLVRSQALCPLSYGSNFWYPERDLNSHYTGSKPDLSASWSTGAHVSNAFGTYPLLGAS